MHLIGHLFSCMYIGVFQQYDGIMCPEKPVKTVWGTVKGAVNRLLVGSSSPTEMNIPTHDQAQQQCLQVYLRDYKDMLLNCNVSDIYSVQQSILSMFYQLLYPKVHHHDSSHTWPAAGVTQVCVYIYAEKLYQALKVLKHSLCITCYISLHI